MEHPLNHFHVTESNRLEGLLQAFKLLAFAKGKNPFAKRIVLVPSNAFKMFLKINLEVTFGLNLHTYEDGLIHLAHLYLEKNERKVPTFLELTMRLQMELIHLIENQSLISFLGPKFTGSVTPYVEKKLYFLAKTLSKLFLNYGRFAPLEAENPDDNFQIFLFNKIFKEGFEWTTRIDTLATRLKKSVPFKDVEIFVFAPFMTKEEVDFLKKIATKASVEVFSLNPTSYLLDDLSDREEKRSSLPVSLKNPLLANYSLLQREMQRNIIDSTDSVSSLYLVDSFAEEVDEWSSLIHDDHVLVGNQAPTLLKALQTDLTLMRIPEEKISLTEEHLSIELHAADNRFREIEILHEELIKRVSHLNLRLMDIQVFAKDIKLFEPAIKAVFGRKESPLKYVLHSEKTYSYPLVQAFLNLLGLSFKRFEASNIIGLLETKAFRKKWNLSSSAIQTIRTYVDEEAFEWGENVEDKNAYYHEKGFLKSTYDTSNIGTKEHFEARLLERFYKGEEEGFIGITDADTIAVFFKLLNTLSEDLGFLASKAHYPLHKWSVLLKNMLEKHFVEDEGYEFIQETLDALKIIDPVVESTPCHFITAFHILQDALLKGAPRDKEDNINAIRFSSFLPHHAMPGKIIALIGLEEGVFPGNDPQDSLNLLKSTGSFIPKNSDTDRFLFLEAVLSARDFLYLSYSKTDSKGEENTPSIALTDLFQYLDKAFILNNKLPSECCHFEHQKQRYHPSYFQENSLKKSSSITHFKEAHAHLSTKSSVRHFIASEKQQNKIEISQIVNFLKNPLKTYLKASNIYLPLHAMDADKHVFELSHLSKHALKKSYFVEDFALNLEKHPAMPPKLFRDLEIKKILRDQQSIHEFVSSMGINPSELFTVNILPYAESPIIQEEGIYFPAITVDTIILHGKIDWVSPLGLLRLESKNKWKDRLPALFELALLQNLKQEGGSTLFLVGEKGEKMQIDLDPEYLKMLVKLYLEGIKRPLLLLPSLFKPIESGDPVLLKNEIEKAFDPFNATSESHYLKWIYGTHENISPESLIEDLQPLVKELIRPLSEALSKVFNKL